MNTDWESLAKRLIGLNSIGFRIEQASGHRWIVRDDNADFIPTCLRSENHACMKEYGSYVAALDKIDALLQASGQRCLIQRFNNYINYCDDLGVIFGIGTQ